MTSNDLCEITRRSDLYDSWWSRMDVTNDDGHPTLFSIIVNFSIGVIFAPTNKGLLFLVLFYLAWAGLRAAKGNGGPVVAILFSVSVSAYLLTRYYIYGDLDPIEPFQKEPGSK